MDGDMAVVLFLAVLGIGGVAHTWWWARRENRRMDEESERWRAARVRRRMDL